MGYKYSCHVYLLANITPQAISMSHNERQPRERGGGLALSTAALEIWCWASESRAPAHHVSEPRINTSSSKFFRQASFAGITVVSDLLPCPREYNTALPYLYAIGSC